MGCGKKKKGKKVALIVLLALLMVAPAFADQTGTTLWHKHSYVDKDTCNYVDKYSEYQKKQNWPMGVGVDAIIYEFDKGLSDYGLQTVNVEGKYDIANGGMSVFGVCHVNLFQGVKKLLNQ